MLRANFTPLWSPARSAAPTARSRRSIAGSSASSGSGRSCDSSPEPLRALAIEASEYSRVPISSAAAASAELSHPAVAAASRASSSRYAALPSCWSRWSSCSSVCNTFCWSTAVQTDPTSRTASRQSAVRRHDRLRRERVRAVPARGASARAKAEPASVRECQFPGKSARDPHALWASRFAATTFSGRVWRCNRAGGTRRTRWHSTRAARGPGRR
jgi:hypothetical protein